MSTPMHPGPPNPRCWPGTRSAMWGSPSPSWLPRTPTWPGMPWRSVIAVHYAPLPAVIDPLTAMHPDTPVVHADLGTNGVLHVTSTGGDLEAAFVQADLVIRQQYQVQRLAPAPMETRGVVADYNPQDDRLTVWDSTQNPHGMKPRLAQVLGRPASSIRVVTPDVGGGFGQKGCLFP